MTWYGVLKLLHVLSVIIWIGGSVAIVMLLTRLARAGDRATVAALVPAIQGLMQVMAGPAAGIVLVTGIAMVWIGKLGWGTLWVSAGFAGVILLGAFGGVVMQKRVMALKDIASAPGETAALAAAGARVRQASYVFIAIVVAIIAVMVLKPTR